MSNTKKETRNILILARYVIKKDHVTKDGKKYVAGQIVLLVRNDKGVEYFVTLRPHSVHSCTCPHVSTNKCRYCYHITACITVENARFAAAKLKKELEQICEEAERELTTPAQKEALSACDKAPLNGNRPFALLK